MKSPNPTKTNNPSQEPKANSQQPFKEYMNQQGYSQSTIDYHQNVIHKLKQWLDKQTIEPQSATYNDILAYTKYRQQKGTHKLGMSRYLTAIKNYYTYLVSTSQTAVNPALSIKIQGLPRKKPYDILNAHELTTLYQKYIKQDDPNDPYHARDIAITGLIIYQGLNTTDLSRLETQHIELRAGTIQIPSTRRSNQRKLQLEPVQVMDLYHYIQTARKELQTSEEQTTLFFSTTGTDNIHHVIRRVVKRLQKANPRTRSLLHIRASVITKWLKKHNLRQAQYMAGHRHISSTEQYQVNDLEGLQEEINQYHPLG